MQHTLRVLEDIRAKSDSVIVSYSGGKDSLVVLDLAVKNFKRVECFFMYLVKDLEHVERFLQLPKQRYGIEVRQYPHWMLSHYLKNGLLRLHSDQTADLPSLRIGDIENRVRIDTGIQWIASGLRKVDSIDRRLRLKTYRMEAINDKSHTFFPIGEWRTKEVVSYLRMNRIPFPESYANINKSSGVDIDYTSLKFIRTHYPADYQKILKLFPFAEVHFIREEFYGKRDQQVPKVQNGDSGTSGDQERSLQSESD